MNQSKVKLQDEQFKRLGGEALKSVLNALPELAFLITRDGKYLEVFGAPENLMVRRSKELIGNYVSNVMPEDKSEFVLATITECLKKKCNVNVVYQLEVPSGLCTFEAGVIPFEHPDHIDEAVLWFARDITEQVKKEENLRRMAFYDPLTNLPNRRVLDERLEEENARCRRHNQKSAVFFIDLDDFKAINDKYSHGFGDDVLVEVAKRLKLNVRIDDFVCRLAGDEFVVVLSMINGDENSVIQHCTDAARVLLDKLSEPIIIDNIRVECEASIGVRLLPCKHQKAKRILRDADDAMYRSKEKGSGHISFY
ncbi:sensor domain-containing diguanylate cyclase [Aliikangiella sp. G2MR2-5]|uniref:sensor domain-containing diguanylate cyclase n=1 Tax=Aliikangiella sp. G2MR2-5 TaxID=2788943 RepID=UPI0018AA5635|nr:sensor domain-containing diguanylate cyclase [Aliikangiella sp. G2MR2-5]